jgi:GT2 family glycosyltransferase
VNADRRKPISLIIASRNRRAMLRDSVRSVLAGTVVPAEIVVIDQSDAPDGWFSRPVADRGTEVRYVWTIERGLSRANNLGVRLASHDAVAFTHDDVRVDPSWLAAVWTGLREGGRNTVVTGRIEADSAGEDGFAPTLRVGTVSATYRGRVGYDVLKPLNMAMYRSALEAVGGFDPRLGPGTPFPGAEDSDLGYRLLEAGFTIRYLPDALVHHRAWRTWPEFLPLRWAYGVAQGGFFAKHLRRSDLHILHRFIFDVLRRARRLPRRALREGSRALADPVFIAGNLVGAARWWRAHGVIRESPFPSYGSRCGTGTPADG